MQRHGNVSEFSSSARSSPSVHIRNLSMVLLVCLRLCKDPSNWVERSIDLGEELVLGVRYTWLYARCRIEDVKALVNWNSVCLSSDADFVKHAQDSQ